VLAAAAGLKSFSRFDETALNGLACCLDHTLSHLLWCGLDATTHRVCGDSHALALGLQSYRSATTAVQMPGLGLGWRRPASQAMPRKDEATGVKVFIDPAVLERIDQTNPAGMSRTAWVNYLIQVGIAQVPANQSSYEHIHD